MTTIMRVGLIGAVISSLIIQSGCRKKTQEKATPEPLASDTLLSPESRPLEIVPIKWPDTLRPTEREIPAAIVWNYFDSTSHSRRTFSPGERDVLSREGFFIEEYPTVSGIITDDMVDAYQHLYVDAYGQSYSTAPVFISSDFLLHVFHVVFDRMLQNVEEKRFLPLLDSLTVALLEETGEQMRGSAAPALRDIARRNAAFLGVAARLIGDSARVPAEAEELVKDELALVEQADGFHRSPLMKAEEDYSQYKARGHYTSSERLTRFFKAMMWYGRRSFSCNSDTLALQAILLSALLERPENRALWERIARPSEFIAGSSDDLTLFDCAQLAREVYGSDQFASPDTAKLHHFERLAGERATPKISGNALPNRLDPASIERGFRFLGQRTVPDAYIFSELTSPRVGTDVHPRNLPSSLDVMAILGSAIADSLIAKESSVPGYAAKMSALKSEFSDEQGGLWRQNFYWCWLNVLRPLLKEKGPEFPAFMQGRKWATKGLLTSLGSWTELKHDTFLFSKQSYAEMGEGGDEEIPKPPPQPKSYVEADLQFFNRLVYLVERTRATFARMGLLTDEYQRKLALLFSESLRLRSIVQKELLNEQVTEEEYDVMLHFAQTIDWTILPEDRGDIIEDQYKQMALVIDTHTDALGGVVLENAIGSPQRIYVAVKDSSGGCRVCAGYVYSACEFTQPINQRMTDEQWKKIVYGGASHAMREREPAWEKSLRLAPK